MRDENDEKVEKRNLALIIDMCSFLIFTRRLRSNSTWSIFIDEYRRKRRRDERWLLIEHFPMIHFFCSKRRRRKNANLDHGHICEPRWPSPLALFKTLIANNVAILIPIRRPLTKDSWLTWSSNLLPHLIDSSEHMDMCFQIRERRLKESNSINNNVVFLHYLLNQRRSLFHARARISWA